jgi:hypothetical protein
MSLTDRELIELAAEAAGVVGDYHEYYAAIIVRDDDYVDEHWNPLTDDGDSLRLSVKLGLSIIHQHTFAGPEPVAVAAGFCADDFRLTSVDYNGDPGAATRRTVVLAAAEIAKARKAKAGA